MTAESSELVAGWLTATAISVAVWCAVSCGGAAATGLYGVASAACLAESRAIVARHGDEATAEDEADFEANRRVCKRLLDRIEREASE